MQWAESPLKNLQFDGRIISLSQLGPRLWVQNGPSVTNPVSNESSLNTDYRKALFVLLLMYFFVAWQFGKFGNFAKCGPFWRPLTPAEAKSTLLKSVFEAYSKQFFIR